MINEKILNIPKKIILFSFGERFLNIPLYKAIPLKSKKYYLKKYKDVNFSFFETDNNFENMELINKGIDFQINRKSYLFNNFYESYWIKGEKDGKKIILSFNINNLFVFGEGNQGNNIGSNIGSNIIKNTIINNIIQSPLSFFYKNSTNNILILTSIYNPHFLLKMKEDSKYKNIMDKVVTNLKPGNIYTNINVKNKNNNFLYLGKVKTKIKKLSINFKEIFNINEKYNEKYIYEEIKRNINIDFLKDFKENSYLIKLKYHKEEKEEEMEKIDSSYNLKKNDFNDFINYRYKKFHHTIDLHNKILTNFGSSQNIEKYYFSVVNNWNIKKLSKSSYMIDSYSKDFLSEKEVDIYLEKMFENLLNIFYCYQRDYLRNNIVEINNIYFKIFDRKGLETEEDLLHNLILYLMDYLKNKKSKLKIKNRKTFLETFSNY